MRGTSGGLRRTRRSRYRCSLPGLAGFAGPRRTEPEVPRSGSRASRDCESQFNILICPRNAALALLGRAQDAKRSLPQGSPSTRPPSTPASPPAGRRPQPQNIFPRGIHAHRSFASSPEILRGLTHRAQRPAYAVLQCFAVPLYSSLDGVPPHPPAFCCSETPGPRRQRIAPRHRPGVPHDTGIARLSMRAGGNS
jgi:hypothetical protein